MPSAHVLRGEPNSRHEEGRVVSLWRQLLSDNALLRKSCVLGTFFPLECTLCSNQFCLFLHYCLLSTKIGPRSCPTNKHVLLEHPLISLAPSFKREVEKVNCPPISTGPHSSFCPWSLCLLKGQHLEALGHFHSPSTVHHISVVGRSSYSDLPCPFIHSTGVLGLALWPRQKLQPSYCSPFPHPMCPTAQGGSSPRKLSLFLLGICRGPHCSRMKPRWLAQAVKFLHYEAQIHCLSLAFSGYRTFLEGFFDARGVWLGCFKMWVLL